MCDVRAWILYFTWLDNGRFILIASTSERPYNMWRAKRNDVETKQLFCHTFFCHTREVRTHDGIVHISDRTSQWKREREVVKRYTTRRWCDWYILIEPYFWLVAYRCEAPCCINDVKVNHRQVFVGILVLSISHRGKRLVEVKNELKGSNWKVGKQKK